MVAIDVSRSEKASEEASSGVEAGKRGVVTLRGASGIWFSQA